MLTSTGGTASIRPGLFASFKGAMTEVADVLKHAFRRPTQQIYTKIRIAGVQ